MKFFNRKPYKYLILIPVFFLVANALYFRHAAKEISGAMLREKYLEVVHATDMLAAAVEANPEREWLRHERNIIDSVEYVDRLEQVYAGAYKLSDGELVLLTERFYETTPIVPTDYQEFLEAIYAYEYGGLVVGFAPEDQPYLEVHLYFRWAPLYSSVGERYLIVTGITEYSIVTKIPLWVSAGQWASTAVTFVLNVWLVVLLTRLGYIYEQREGDKWRWRWSR
jgi:hypothetical protein